MVPPPVRESGTEFLGKNNRTKPPTFSGFGPNIAADGR
jgi:hypothetical protein